MTELEGAILGAVRRSPGVTAYVVRKGFINSRSAEWSGSAGAVYPAIARLVREGFLKESATADGRGTKTYLLKPAGIAAHDAWVCDVPRAAGPGLDPFRTRAGHWAELSPAKRRALFQRLENELLRQREELKQEAASPEDKVYGAMIMLHIALLDSRLAWLKKQRG